MSPMTARLGDSDLKALVPLRSPNQTKQQSNQKERAQQSRAADGCPTLPTRLSGGMALITVQVYGESDGHLYSMIIPRILESHDTHHFEDVMKAQYISILPEMILE